MKEYLMKKPLDKKFKLNNSAVEIAHESIISKTMKEKLKTLWIKSFESNNLTVYKLQTNFIICILKHIYLGTSTNNSLGEQSSVIFNILFGNCEGSNCRHFDD